MASGSSIGPHNDPEGAVEHMLQALARSIADLEDQVNQALARGDDAVVATLQQQAAEEAPCLHVLEHRLWQVAGPMVGREAARLTQRQRDVAACIAEGLSNEEIAERLSITPGTAANHIEHILARLGLRSRTQIAVWAVEQGLYRSGQSLV